MSPKELKPEQKAMLEEFRTQVSDILDDFEIKDDDILLHYLQVKKWKMDKALKKIRAAHVWRMEQQALVKNWDPPQVLKCGKYLPYGFCGVDKDNDPVIIFRACVDHKGIWKSSGKDNLYKFIVMEAERIYAELKEDAKKKGKERLKVTAILDMEDFPMEIISKPKYINFILELYNLADKYLPTSTTPIIKTAYVINNKGIHKAAIDLAKTILPESMFAKAKFFGDNADKWKAALLDVVNADQLPPHWGGTRAGKDEYCSDIICQGGTVPKEMYIQKKK